MEKKFDDKYFIKRKDQYNFSAYRNFYNEESIITFKPILIKLFLKYYFSFYVLDKSLHRL
jgi:hypothetical protein